MSGHHHDHHDGHEHHHHHHLPISDHEVTFEALLVWYHKVFAKYGHMVLLHHDQHLGQRVKIVAYAVSIHQLHKAIDLKLKVVHSKDKKRDLEIMHGKLTRLRDIALEHFKIEHADLVERIENVRAMSPLRSAASRMYSSRSPAY